MIYPKVDSPIGESSKVQSSKQVSTKKRGTALDPKRQQCLFTDAWKWYAAYSQKASKKADGMQQRGRQEVRLDIKTCKPVELATNSSLTLQANTQKTSAQTKSQSLPIRKGSSQTSISSFFKPKNNAKITLKVNTAKSIHSKYSI